MSPAATRRFRVRLMVGRTLTRSIKAADEATAIAIGEYLFREFFDRHFNSDLEEILDGDAELDEEASS